MCKPAMQNNTVSFYVLETAQHYLGRRLQGCSFLRICLNICSNNLPAIDREDLDEDFVCFSAMPLFLCCALLSGVGRTFIDEKPCPKLKRVIKGKSTLQNNTVILCS